jgi:apolipoprotein N-acyltransferase
VKLFKNKIPRSPEEIKERRKDRLLLLLSGILLGVSFPPFPMPFPLLMFISLIPFFYVINKKERLIDINKAAYFTFFITCLITIYWVGSWQQESDVFLMISGGLLLFVNPVFFLISTTLYYYSRKIFPERVTLYLFPLFWITYEFVYMITDASFPWLTLGSGLSKFLSFIQIAELIGAVGISLIVVYINVLLFKAFSIYKSSGRIFTPQIAAAFALFLIPLIYGYIRINNFEFSEEKIKVGVIQPNIDPWDKWAEGSPEKIAAINIELSEKAVNEGAELIIWPETAVPVYLLGGGYSFIVDSIYNFLNSNNVSLLTGMPHINYYTEDEKKPDDVKHAKEGNFYYSTYNAILLMQPGTREIQKYGKMKLVPFGERVPFVDLFPILGKWIKWGVGLSGWNVGKDTTVFKMPGGIDSIRINGLVCYESIYPYFVPNFVEKGADLIVVVTNDSWYGNSSGPYQHKEYSVLRAIENRKSVVRSANGGISTVIDPLGRTIIETAMFEKTYFTEDVVIQKGSTFFSRYSMIIPLLASAFSVWVLGIFILKKIKNKYNL